MKSRLLPPSTVGESEFDDDSFSTSYARRASDLDDVDINTEDEFQDEQSVVAVEQPEQQSVKSEQARVQKEPSMPMQTRPNGRIVVAAILLVCVVGLGSLVWSTFFRDVAYGVVTGRVTALSVPWSGWITAVYVRAGDRVRQGDVLAVVSDPELTASIERLGDEMRIAQAELTAQATVIAIAAQQRLNRADEIRANYFDMRGELLSEQSRFDELSSKLERRQALAQRQAYSEEEIESLRFLRDGLSKKIENLQQAVSTLESRLTSAPDETSPAAQLKPLLAKIESLQSEIQRLRERQQRGAIRAPENCTVVAVTGNLGERATPDQKLMEVLPENSLELVIYVPQEDVNDFEFDQVREIVVDSLEESIECRVTRIARRLEEPESHVPGHYRKNEKLLPVYLTPTSEQPSVSYLSLGSTVRMPWTLFGP